MKKTEVSSTLTKNLPIFQHIELESVGLDPNKWKKGEKGIYRLAAIALFGAAAYGLWVYVLPALFIALAKLVVIAIFSGFLIFLFLARKLIYKVMRSLVRKMHKALIKNDKFGELERQRQRMIAQKNEFKGAKTKIKGLRNQSQKSADENQIKAKNLQEQIKADSKTAEKLKSEVKGYEDSGKTNSDEYVEAKSKLTRKLNSVRRTMRQYEHAKLLIEKYGTRAHTMARLERKLALVGIAVDDKVLDFDTSVEMLKAEYEFARSARTATEAAKGAMGLTHSWELEYALEVVTGSIEFDLAATSENLLDIDELTQKYAMDDDQLYDELDAIADKINSGEETITDSRKYTNPNYKLTREEKLISGGFGDLF